MEKTRTPSNTAFQCAVIRLCAGLRGDYAWKMNIQSNLPVDSGTVVFRIQNPFGNLVQMSWELRTQDALQPYFAIGTMESLTARVLMKQALLPMFKVSISVLIANKERCLNPGCGELLEYATNVIWL